MPTNTLTVKQSKFAAEYLKDGNASRAYRDSYDAGSMSARAIHVESGRLLNHPLIALRVQEGRQRMAEKAEITLQKVIDMLLADREFAIERKNPSAAIAATMGLARVTGHMVEDRRNEKRPLAEFGTEQLQKLEQLLADMAGDGEAIH